MREISSATPSTRTHKTFWRPSMPPNSPTEKSLNGSDGTADGPMSEQPATAHAAAVMSTATRRRNFPAVHNTMTNWPMTKVPERTYFLIKDRSTYCMIPPLR
jgi:hypothetical protein